jgi:tetratricopeptide (TPR) repeat protein
MQGQHELAEEPFANACKFNVREPDACYFYGRNQYALNRFERSIEALQKALTTDPQPARVYVGMAQAFEALGNTERALSNFEAAVKSTPRLKPDNDPRIAFSLFHFRLGKLSQARKLAEAAAAEHPSSSKAQLQLARVLYQQGHIEEAVSVLEKTVELDRNSATAHLLLSKAYSRQGKAELAQRHATIAEQLGLK